MRKFVLAVLLLAVAGASIFFYGKCFMCKKVDFATIINKKYIYINNDIESDITISFSDDSIFGSAGVNRYFAGYKFDGNRIQFSPIGSTMMAGPMDKMELEREYLELLGKVDRVEVCKTKLILKTKDNRSMKFVEVANSKNQKEDSNVVSSSTDLMSGDIESDTMDLDNGEETQDNGVSMPAI